MPLPLPPSTMWSESLNSRERQVGYLRDNRLVKGEPTFIPKQHFHRCLKEVRLSLLQSAEGTPEREYQGDQVFLASLDLYVLLSPML